MHVGVVHRVSDPAAFARATEEATAAGVPDGFALPLRADSEDGRVTVCLWEGPSVEAVRDLVEPVVGRFSENEYLVMRVHGLPMTTA
jgi:hypothetical protein